MFNVPALAPLPHSAAAHPLLMHAVPVIRVTFIPRILLPNSTSDRRQFALLLPLSLSSVRELSYFIGRRFGPKPGGESETGLVPDALPARRARPRITPPRRKTHAHTNTNPVRAFTTNAGNQNLLRWCLSAFTPVRASLKHNITVSDLESPSKKYTVLYAVNASVAVAVIIAFSFAFAPLIFQLYIIDVDSK
ncbi:hypothetical protein BKA62DRAFT_777835 [Auriculariales sp. MPI-PUGE-AT-0066]|nr:hypothetical protein BKA62DRAFT_777835 [Auriculariales sp. MPI-PUGE-AT-0066]